MNWYKKAQFLNDGKNIAIYQYISPRRRELSQQEAFVRKISYEIKNKNSDAIKIAADTMAKYVASNSLLVPVPSSSGDRGSNMLLCEAIAKITGSEIYDPLGRSSSIEPSHQRRKQNLPNYTVEEHNMIVRDDADVMDLDNKNVYFVDNVITKGTTIEACKNALGVNGVGLAWAKA